jgi:hypothetical protein
VSSFAEKRDTALYDSSFFGQCMPELVGSASIGFPATSETSERKGRETAGYEMLRRPITLTVCVSGVCGGKNATLS